MFTDLSLFRRAGPGVSVYNPTKILKPEQIEVGEGTQIDEFVLINGGQGVRLGRMNHIASFVSIIGGGTFETGDYAGIAAGARIVTGTHHYGDGQRISPLIPPEDQCVIRGRVVLGADVLIGTNAIVHPNVTIGEGAIVGSGSLVVKDVDPWTINVGVPVRTVGKRPRIRENERTST